MARVLVADDAAISRKLMTEMLEGAGHRVVGAAADGEEAIALFAELQPEVTVLDVNMPVLDGLGAAETIRRSSPAARLILASVFSSEERLRRAAELGAVAYLKKPFDAAELAAAVTRGAADPSP